VKAIGVFAHDKTLNGSDGPTIFDVRVFPLHVKRQSKTWPEIDQRVVQCVGPEKALTLINDPALKAIVSAFVKRIAAAAGKLDP
jgi:hypothetical protein